MDAMKALAFSEESLLGIWHADAMDAMQALAFSEKRLYLR